MDECDFENGVEGCFREKVKRKSRFRHALHKQIRSVIAAAIQVEFRIYSYVSKRPSGSLESNLHGS